MSTSKPTSNPYPTGWARAPRPPQQLCAGSRREFLWQMGAGFAGLALTALLDQDGFFAAKAAAASSGLNPLAP